MPQIDRARIASATSRALARLQVAFWPIVQASVGAAIAWYVAHTVLHHQQPFFAPIAAAITMSTTQLQRSRRTVQLVIGVLLGIAIGEGLVALLGSSAVAVGLIVFVAFAVAVLSSGGFIGEGMLFANQTAASAILIATLRRHGAGVDRAVDALVGGGVALTFVVLLFPPDPIKMLTHAESRVLRSLGETLEGAARQLSRTGPGGPGWLRARRSDGRGKMDVLLQSQSTARGIARVAPRRWHQRAAVETEIKRFGRAESLVDSVVEIARAATAGIDGPALHDLRDDIARLGHALDQLGDAAYPWRVELREEVRLSTAHALTGGPPDRAGAVRTLLHATAADLAGLVDTPQDGARGG
jgi:uncharacterized membrane protein YgaE (UPF0421/DUF939 family)